MPKQIIDDKIWSDRITVADRYYKQWESLYKCNILEKYYEGNQWKSQRSLSSTPYVINKFYETIQIKLAQFIPTLPQFNVTPKAQSMQYDIEEAIDSATLKQDVLNTLIADDNQEFSSEVEDAYRDSFFRFGCLEVGYSADWVINPNAPKPLLAGNTDGDASNKSKIKEQPEELPINERIYFKHIPAKTFRVGGIDHKYLHRCGWYGYYEWVYKDDLLSIKGLMNQSKLETAESVEMDSESNEMYLHSDNQRSGAVKLWHIWDRRANLELLILDSPKLTIWQRKQKRVRIFDLRPDKALIRHGFYPIPPTFHWTSPQDELNEIREMMRSHRRRFVRKFMALEGKIDDAEMEKFETGPDGAIFKVRDVNAITPVQNADLGASVQIAESLSSDDLNKISGTSNPQRGIADRSTATESNIIQQEGSIRENKERDRLVLWFNKIGREILLTARDKFTLGIWTQSQTPEGGQLGQEMQAQESTWQWVAAEQLHDGYDFRVTVDITSLSSTYQEQEMKKMVQFLTILTQYPMCAFSPVLVREVAFRCGYRNMKVIKEFQQMALLMQASKMSQLGMGAAGSQGGQQAQAIGQQMTPPTNTAIQNQLGNQLQTAVQ